MFNVFVCFCWCLVIDLGCIFSILFIFGYCFNSFEKMVFVMSGDIFLYYLFFVKLIVFFVFKWIDVVFDSFLDVVLSKRIFLSVKEDIIFIKIFRDKCLNKILEFLWILILFFD